MSDYLNSWSDDWSYPVSSAEPSTDQVPTIETIRQVMQEFEKNHRSQRVPEVWVLTHYEMQELKMHCEKRDPVMEPSGILSDPWNIYGIRIEEVATKEEAIDRVAELASKGVKAGYLKESE